MSAVGRPRHSGPDLETSGHDLEKSAAGLEKSTTDLEKSRTDLEKCGTDLEKSRNDLDKPRSTLEKTRDEPKECGHCPGWQTSHQSEPASGQAPRGVFSGPGEVQKRFRGV